MDKRFEELLLLYGQENEADKREKIETTLWQEFGKVKAVFVMDMSGFSLLSHRHGIVHYLSIVKRMQLTTQPIVEKYRGQVVKFEADNCFAMFDDPLSAVRAAIALNTAFFAMNVLTADEFDIRVSIGIDYGDVLLIGGPDYFGNTVNRACKIGEDIGGPGEILVTAAAFKQIPDTAGIQGRKVEIAIAGVPVEVYSIEH
ncbi:MAG TPA: adenylate/guanylate cyclase domain-containing protein [Desulfobaccales bacterium]|nr:adenylate/guanylate cyclase domain-containing protein [Desulfobaccales bacterium]